MTYKPGGGLPVAKEKVLERCTIAELVDELCRRDVGLIETHKHETFVVAHGNASSYFDEGKATILVVKHA